MKIVFAEVIILKPIKKEDFKCSYWNVYESHVGTAVQTKTY